MSSIGLLDLLTVMEPEWSLLPPPLSLFLREAEAGLANLEATG